WRSAFVAGIFAVHPINVESVTWIAERKNVLSSFFLLLTIWVYVWYARNPGWKRYLSVGVMFAMGLMCKPMLVTLPFALLLLDYWPLNRARILPLADESKTGKPDGPKRRHKEATQNYPPRTFAQLAIEKLPLLLLAVGSSAVTVFAQQKGGAVGSFERFPFGARLANAIASYGAYLVAT